MFYIDLVIMNHINCIRTFRSFQNSGQTAENTVTNQSQIIILFTQIIIIVKRYKRQLV